MNRNNWRPESFSKQIGKQLDDKVSDWPVVDFQQIKKSHFITLPNKIIDDFSSVWSNAYKIFWTVTWGDTDDDLHFRKVGSIVRS